MIGLKKGIVKLVPYSPGWTIAFEKEKRRLLVALRSRAIHVEHVGSTAIPGMPAKPIIDIMVGVPVMRGAKRLISQFKKAGYDWWKEFGNHRQQLFFRYGGRIWHNYLFFRDHFTKNKEAFNQYIKLKKELAQKFKDKRTMYTAVKAVFTHSIIGRARMGKI